MIGQCKYICISCAIFFIRHRLRDAIHIFLVSWSRESGSINMRRGMEIRVTLQFSRFISIGRILNERYIVGQISGREIHEMYFYETRIIADVASPFSSFSLFFFFKFIADTRYFVIFRQPWKICDVTTINGFGSSLRNKMGTARGDERHKER